MRLSVVSTLFSSAPYLDEFYQRIVASAERITDDYEVILVNDGSADDSLQIAVGMHDRDPRVRVIDLSRNFGHHKAMMTGLAQTRGELVFLIDCDLEEEPELLEPFHEELVASDVDVVYGVQRSRKGGWFERLSGAAFYWLFNKLSTDPIPRNVVVARLMTARYVAALLEHREREILIAGLWAATGFEQKELLVDKEDKGATAYTVRRKLAHLVNAITSFSGRPLLYVFYLGAIVMLGSGAAATYYAVRRLFFDAYLPGWTSLIVTVWFLGGLIIFCQGVLGVYLSKVFSETKQRPYTIIRQIYERGEEGEDPLAERRHGSVETAP